MRKEFVVGGEKPHCCVGIDYPVAKSSRQANFRFKSPTVCPVIDQLRRVVLSGRSHYPEAHTHEGLLPPFAVVPHVHGRTTLQIDGAPERGIQQTRAVCFGLGNHCSPKSTDCVGERAYKASCAPKQAERMKEA